MTKKDISLWKYNAIPQKTSLFRIIAALSLTDVAGDGRVAHAPKPAQPYPRNFCLRAPNVSFMY